MHALCRSFSLVVALAVALAASAQAANVIVVTNNQTTAQSLTDFLTAEGHVLTVGQFADAPPDPGTLDVNDLIVVARDSNSGDYDEAGEPALWNGLTLPMISLNPFLDRTSRWGWVDGTGMTAGAQSDFDPYPDPSHPFLSGVTGTTMLTPPAVFSGNGMNVMGQVLPEGATLVATIGGELLYGAYDIPAGATAFADLGTFGARRASLFLGGEGNFSFTTADARQILRNMIDELTDFGPPPTPGDVDGDGDVDTDDFELIRANFRMNVTMRNQGDLVRDGEVNFHDFREWKAEFLAGGGSLAEIDFAFTSSVPEPCSIAMLLPLALVSLYRRRA